MEDKGKRQTEVIKRKREQREWEGVSKNVKRKSYYFLLLVRHVITINGSVHA
jgi:hypothetical protein